MTHTPNVPPDPIAASLSADGLPPEGVSLALLARAKGGDDTALVELLTRYQERLRRIVRIQLGSSRLRHVHDSMDVVQDTFLAALPKIRDLAPRSAAGLLQWLSLIATNRIRDAHDHQHAAKRDLRRTVPLAPSSTSGAGFSPVALDFNPSDAAELAEIRDLLDDAVAQLPEDQRRVVILRDYCGEAWERVADELHRAPGATRQLHQRAWIRLRSALRPALEDHKKPPGMSH